MATAANLPTLRDSIAVHVDGTELLLMIMLLLLLLLLLYCCTAAAERDE